VHIKLDPLRICTGYLSVGSWVLNVRRELLARTLARALARVLARVPARQVFVSAFVKIISISTKNITIVFRNIFGCFEAEVYLKLNSSFPNQTKIVENFNIYALIYNVPYDLALNLELAGLK